MCLCLSDPERVWRNRAPSRVSLDRPRQQRDSEKNQGMTPTAASTAQVPLGAWYYRHTLHAGEDYFNAVAFRSHKHK